MRIIFALFFSVSLYIAFSGKSEKPKGILDTVLKESEFRELSVDKKPARLVSEFSQDQYGHTLEVRKGYSETNELIEEVSYKAGRKFGPSKWWTAGVLRKSSWYYDTSGEQALTIDYDASGNVIAAACNSGIRFTEEHEKVCGWKAPFTFTRMENGGKLEITMEQGNRSSSKQYFPGGGIWIKEWIADNKMYRNTYHKNGKLNSENVMEFGGWFEKRYNNDGILIEKHVGLRDPGPYREEVSVFDQKGVEVALWEVHKLKKKRGFSTEGCTLMRSLASEAPRPSVCP